MVVLPKAAVAKTVVVAVMLVKTPSGAKVVHVTEKKVKKFSALGGLRP